MKRIRLSMAPLLAGALIGMFTSTEMHAQAEPGASVTGAGGVRATDGEFRLDATLGQAAIGWTATNGRNAGIGFWHGASPAASAGIAEDGTKEETAGGLLLYTSPNPFSASTRISLQIPHTGQVSLMLYDAAGRLIRTLLDAEQQQGELGLTLFADDLPSGRYTLAMTAGNERQTTSLVLVK